LSLENTNQAWKLAYHPWTPLAGSLRNRSERPTLVDDLGNKYAQVMAPIGQEVVGQRTSDVSLYAGKDERDVLVFERAVPAAKYLYLDLPLDHIDGATGTV